jgi:Na+-transporting NADH:ubiquinone oxidoreductase subunit NqrC
MARQTRKRISGLLLVIVGLQVVLPVILALAILAVKNCQQRIVEANDKASGVFTCFHLADMGRETGEGNEFCYNGILYDIKAIERENGQYVVYALADESETKLASAKCTRSEGAVTQRDVKIFPLLLLFHEVPGMFTLQRWACCKEHSGHYLANTEAICIAVNSPPPRLV